MQVLNYIYPAEPPRVVVYETEYEWVGDEGDQTAEGDYEGATRRVVFCVPDRWDIEDGKTSVDLAVDVLNDQPAYLEPDCVPGTPSWFSGSDHENDRAWLVPWFFRGNHDRHTQRSIPAILALLEYEHDGQKREPKSQHGRCFQYSPAA